MFGCFCVHVVEFVFVKSGQMFAPFLLIKRAEAVSMKITQATIDFIARKSRNSRAARIGQLPSRNRPNWSE